MQHFHKINLPFSSNIELLIGVDSGKVCEIKIAGCVDTVESRSHLLMTHISVHRHFSRLVTLYLEFIMWLIQNVCVCLFVCRV